MDRRHMFQRLTSRKLQLLALLVITAGGATLRFSLLQAQSLWNDELATWEITNNNSLSETIDRVMHDTHPPAYYAVVFLVRRIFGDSEAMLRLPSAFFGTLCIPLMFLIGNRLYGRRVGLLTAALTAVLQFPLHYSQEARAYSMLLFFTALSTYFWIGMLQSFRDEGRICYSVGVLYGLSAVISCYTDQEGLYFTALQGIFLLLYCLKSKCFLSVVTVYLAIGIAYLPWLLPLLSQLRNPSYTWIPRPRFSFFPKYIANLFNALDKVHLWLSLTVIAIVVLLYAHLAYRWIRKHRTALVGNQGSFSGLSIDSDVIVLLWLVVPFLGLFVISLLFTPVLIYRALIISLPAAYLLFSQGVFSLPMKQSLRDGIALGVILLFLADLFLVVDYYGTPRKEQYREAVRLVADSSVRYGDPLVVANQELFDYYFHRYGSKKKVDVVVSNHIGLAQGIEDVRRSHARYVWYLNGHTAPVDGLLRFLSSEFTLVIIENYSGGTGLECGRMTGCVFAALFAATPSQ